MWTYLTGYLRDLFSSLIWEFIVCVLYVLFVHSLLLSKSCRLLHLKKVVSGFIFYSPPLFTNLELVQWISPAIRVLHLLSPLECFKAFLCCWWWSLMISIEPFISFIGFTFITLLCWQPQLSGLCIVIVHCLPILLQDHNLFS